MTRTRIAAALVITLFATAACQQKDEANEPKSVQPQTSLETTLDKQAYSLGLFAGKFIQKNVKGYADVDIQLDSDKVVAGFRDAIAGQGQLDDKTVEQILTDLEKQRAETMKTKRDEQAKGNAEAAKTFLAENAKKDGVKTTDSGLQYQVLQEGKGEKPTADDIVTVNYRGTLIDGKQFDSSYDRKQPATFPLKQVIKGWTEGVQLMTVGSKYRFFIPPELGYGERGAGESVPPNAALIFDVELLSIGEPQKEDGPAVNSDADSGE